MCMCVHVCVRVCARVCVCYYACVHRFHGVSDWMTDLSIDAFI